MKTDWTIRFALYGLAFSLFALLVTILFIPSFAFAAGSCTGEGTGTLVCNPSPDSYQFWFAAGEGGEFGDFNGSGDWTFTAGDWNSYFDSNPLFERSIRFLSDDSSSCNGVDTYDECVSLFSGTPMGNEEGYTLTEGDLWVFYSPGTESPATTSIQYVDNPVANLQGVVIIFMLSFALTIYMLRRKKL